MGGRIWAEVGFRTAQKKTGFLRGRWGEKKKMKDRRVPGAKKENQTFYRQDRGGGLGI